MTRIRIATRRSPLALWQAEHVAALLRARHPGLAVELVPMTTSGDQQAEGALLGGKGWFVKELEEALLDQRADVAVHSMKDVPAVQPAGLALAAFLAAEDPRDAFVSNAHASLRELPRGACVGTSSLRRQAQLRAERPDLAVGELRGNVGTRLARLDEKKFDAVLLACAGLARLGLAARITEPLAVERFVPAIGQGIIGIECREDDAATRARVGALNDASSATRLAAERAMNAQLGGSCTVPVAGHAVVAGDRVRLTGLVAAPDGSRVVRDTLEGSAASAAELGSALAERLLAAGGAPILRALGALPPPDDRSRGRA
ncbi:MAG: hydroxymethylbilane synthase [Nevskiaceae bacterium]